VELGNERRSEARYSISLDLKYTLEPASRLALIGHGRTLNLSAHGVLFVSDNALPPGMWIELLIRWPVLLNGEVGLRLHGKGRIVRVQDNRTAVKIGHYDFRTIGPICNVHR
jgi:PilZ domain